MPEEIFPSSYRCDCGHEFHFFENTVNAMKKMSRKKEVRLGDAAPDEHVIVFHRGEMTEIICPHQPQSGETKQRTAKSSARKKRPTKKGIPGEVKTQVDEIVARFHASEIRNPRCRYVPRYRGKFLYLDREDYGRISQICRLEYTGNMEDCLSPSTSTAVSVTMRANGSFQGADMSMAPLKARCERGLKRIQLEHEAHHTDDS